MVRLITLFLCTVILCAGTLEYSIAKVSQEESRGDGLSVEDFPIGSIYKSHEKDLIRSATENFLETLKSAEGVDRLLSSVSFFEKFFNDEVYDEFCHVLQKKGYRQNIKILFVQKAREYPYYYIGLYIEGTNWTWDVKASYKNNSMVIESISKAII